MRDIAISLKNIQWVRGDKTILQDINWTVQSGEHWAVLGLNGSGKTSLLNVVTGYQFPTKGTVTVLGNEYGKSNLQSVRKRIGFVSNSLNRFLTTFNQETALEIVMSGKFASVGLYEEVQEEEWKMAYQLLEAFRIEDQANQRYATLSQGEQRRVLLARAFSAQPDILVLDEPCAGLDIRAREELLRSLSEQTNQSGTSLIYVTHHIEEILPEITHVLLLADGNIVASGLKEEALTADSLSKAFKIPVEVEWKHGRPWLQVTAGII
ncbi:ABC transporter ATP-binding protein [Bacillus thermotolerans]|uniref:ABC transporter ATP-binding protein n=1 Tax=Bacillus thermotolerans TaxID=1221996 RepID=UPI00057F3B2E|nr:ABC transporter ATP-binding protein [Bacillus thermotolerans]KKB35416.1 ABC transporter, ATP-binding protein [Bacillus thermotolerans]